MTNIKHTQPTNQCNCLYDAESLMLKKFKEVSGLPGYKIIESKWEHISIYPKRRLFTNYLVRYTFIKKDGNESKPRNEHMNIFFTYCPFCGAKIG